jgi:hypothetical protein
MVRFRAWIGFDSWPTGVSKSLRRKGTGRNDVDTGTLAEHELRDAEKEANEQGTYKMSGMVIT